MLLLLAVGCCSALICGLALCPCCLLGLCLGTCCDVCSGCAACMLGALLLHLQQLLLGLRLVWCPEHSVVDVHGGRQLKSIACDAWAIVLWLGQACVLWLLLLPAVVCLLCWV
jgi:hypothetical protein